MITSFAIAAVIFAPSQDMSMFAPPKELDQMKYMLGIWTAKGTGMGMDGSTVEMTGTAKCTLQMGRWYQWDTEDNMPGVGKMVGRFMFTYDPMKSKWEGNWFDNFSSYGMKSHGDLKGNSITYLSGDMPDMTGEGTTQYRINFTKKSDQEIQTKIETKMEGQFVTVLAYTYTKG